MYYIILFDGDNVFQLILASNPAGNYTFKVNNKDIGVVRISLLLTFNIFHTLF